MNSFDRSPNELENALSASIFRGCLIQASLNREVSHRRRSSFVKPDRLLLSILFVLSFLLPYTNTCEGEFGIHPVGHPLEGLPSQSGPIAIYTDNPHDDLNRLVHILFTQDLVPEEVQAQLPDERRILGETDPEFFVDGWYFRKRDGKATDRKVFGGDGRISPRRRFEKTERDELLPLLQEVREGIASNKYPVLAKPEAKLLLQWDILTLWWLLEQEKSEDLPLLRTMAMIVKELALPEATLRFLPSGMDELISKYGSPTPPNTKQPFVPSDFALDETSRSEAWIEIGRKSSTLFRADRTLRASRVYLNFGDRKFGIELLAQAKEIGQGKIPIPVATKAILLQQLIGIDDLLRPVSTPMVDEFRIRTLTDPATLSWDNQSSSRDGSNHWIYFRTRHGTIREGIADFRFVPDTAQSLFIEYGTQKHATFAAQCALCHRRTKTGGSDSYGFRVLSGVARPHVATESERRELAETEMSKVTDRLKLRIDEATREEAELRDGKAAKPDKPATRVERNEEQRRAWAAELRKLYAGDLSTWPQPQVDAGVDWKEMAQLPPVEHPADNPFSKHKAELGRLLFFDPRLSESGQIACASCHDPDLGWGDGRTTSFGHSRKLLTRNAPTIRNAAYMPMLFWDGRASSLEDQAQKVLLNPDEMRSSEELAKSLVESEESYRQLYQQSFATDEYSMADVAKAIACFERTIVGGQSRFDAFLKGKHDVFADAELIGLDLFRREARCLNCHHGPLLSDGKLHDIGLSNFGRRFEDLGRYRVTNDPKDVGKFRTPSLRNVTKTGPWMHNGLFELPVALTLYNAGMPNVRAKQNQTRDVPLPLKSPHIKPLGLNRQDLADLLAFLGTLEEPHRRIEPPDLPGLD